MKIHFISSPVVDEDGSWQLSGVHDVSGSYQSVSGGRRWPRPLAIRWWGVVASVGVCHSSVGVVVVRGRCGGCCPWALFVVGAGLLLVGTGSPCCGWAGGCSCRRLLLWVLGVRGRQLSLWVLGVRGRWVVIHGSWAVVCGRWGSCAVYVIRGWRVVVRGQVVRGLGCGLWLRWCRVVRRVSWLAKSDGMSEGMVLTVVHNLNNDKRRRCRRSSFGCHIALGNVAPGNPLVLMRVVGDVSLPRRSCCDREWW